MSCVIASGRTEPCRDGFSGLKTAFFLNFQENAFTVVAGEVTAIDISVTEAFKYDLLNDGNTLVETITSDQNNGTTIFEQSLTLALKKVGMASTVEVNALAKGRPIIVVQDRQGNYRAVGISDGTVLTGDIQSGGAKGDFNGYNLTFTATESSPAPTLSSSAVSALIALVSATNINP